MFSTQIKVRFNHVDPAGIVFYPRYYEMFNQVVEEWCEAQLQYGFKDLIDDGVGFPIASIDANFVNPSELGDLITFDLSVEHVGRSSVRLLIKASCDDEERLNTRLTLVFTEKLTKGIKAKQIPDSIRERMLSS